MIEFSNFRSKTKSRSHFGRCKIVKRKRDKDNVIPNHLLMVHHHYKDKYPPIYLLKNQMQGF